MYSERLCRFMFSAASKRDLNSSGPSEYSSGKALELNPNYPVAYGNMSRILNEIKVYEDRMDDETLKAQIKAYAEKADAGNNDGELEFTIYRKY